MHSQVKHSINMLMYSVLNCCIRNNKHNLGLSHIRVEIECQPLCNQDKCVSDWADFQFFFKFFAVLD